MGSDILSLSNFHLKLFKSINEYEIEYFSSGSLPPPKRLDQLSGTAVGLMHSVPFFTEIRRETNSIK